MRPRALVSIFGLVALLPTSAFADGWRYAREIPQLQSVEIDAATVDALSARNKRTFKETDFATGVLSTVGGAATSYLGSNEPFVGDFNGDGHDDIGVRWTGSGHAGKWTISLNDKSGKFGAGKSVTFAGSALAFQGDNRVIVGDFDGDEFDDVGVQWKSGPHAGQWYVALNDRKGNFKSGKRVTFGGSTLAYQGDNDPIVGDFDGDGFDDIGVRWRGGPHAGKWTASRNDTKGNFDKGTALSFGGSALAYRGDNQVMVADFDGDGHDDIAVHWTGSGHTGKWAVSLNDADGGRHFTTGRAVYFGTGAGDAVAYVGDNVALAGDVNGDGFADVGVHWTGGATNGQWVFSTNRRKASITRTRKLEVRVPVLFLNFAGTSDPIDRAEADDFIARTSRYMSRATHGNVDVQFRYQIVEMDHGFDWTAGVPHPTYDARTGNLINGAKFPEVRDYKGYECRFNPPPGKTGETIVFKNATGDTEAWTDNANIHRNYCQVAERNYARDALSKLEGSDRKAYDALIEWSRAGNGAPTVAFVSPHLHGGGNRTFNSAWKGTAWPFEVAGRSFVHYMYMNQVPSIFAHELGHFVGHGAELYAAADDSQCRGSTADGYLGRFDLMGAQDPYFSAPSAFTRWRFGWAQARHLTPSDAKTTLRLPRAMSAGAERSVVVIQPDPVGHPDEVFVVEYRGKVTVSHREGRSTTAFDYDNLPLDGIYMYHVNGKDPTVAAPTVDLIESIGACPSQLLPHQLAFMPDRARAPTFHDGKPANFAIEHIAKVGDELEFTVTFGK